jgi:hypothetical protein
MMRPLTKLGAQSLHARKKLADQRVSSTMPMFGNAQGGHNYASNNKEKEKQKQNM